VRHRLTEAESSRARIVTATHEERRGIAVPADAVPADGISDNGGAGGGENATGSEGSLPRAVADVVEFTGEGTVVTCVSLGSDTQWAVSLRGRVPAPGETVCVRVPAECLHLFDPHDGARFGGR